MKRIGWYFLLTHLLIFSNSNAQNLERFGVESYVMLTDYQIDTSIYVKTFENDDFYVMQRKSDIENYKLLNARLYDKDSSKTFWVQIEDSTTDNHLFVELARLQCHFTNNQYDLDSGFEVVTFSATGKVWRTSDHFFYVKYLVLNEPDTNSTIEFAIKYKTEGNWWQGMYEQTEE